MIQHSPSETTASTGEQAEFNLSPDSDGDPLEKPDAVQGDLTEHGVEITGTVREPQRKTQRASEWGKDDRDIEENSCAREEEQGKLFADVDDGQQTLTGEDATNQFLFGDE